MTLITAFFIIFLFPGFQPRPAVLQTTENLETTTSSSINCSCQRFDFFMSPNQLGWNSLIAPTYFDVGRCYGQCPYPSQLRTGFGQTIHRQVVDLFVERNPSLVPLYLTPSTCVPRSFRNISLLEKSSNESYKVYMESQMIIDSCFCS